MDQSKGKQQGGKLPDKKSFNNPKNLKGGSGKWPGKNDKWSGGSGKKVSLPGKGQMGNKVQGMFGGNPQNMGGKGMMPGMVGGQQMQNNQGMVQGAQQKKNKPGMGGQQGMVQGAQQGSMPGMMQGMPGMGGQQGQMPGMMQGMNGGQQGPMPGMMQGQQQGPMPGMQGGQQGGPQQLPPGSVMGQGQFPGGGQLPRERSYIENILRLNRGKPATLYFTFENNDEWNAEVFRGIIEEAGKDHIVVSDPENDRWYLLLMIYLDYIVFDEEIEYEYPFG